MIRARVANKRLLTTTSLVLTAMLHPSHMHMCQHERGVALVTQCQYPARDLLTVIANARPISFYSIQKLRLNSDLAFHEKKINQLSEIVIPYHFLPSAKKLQ